MADKFEGTATDPPDVADAEAEAAQANLEGVPEEGAEEEDEPLELDVEVEAPSACERHVTVTIARKDIDRYFHDAFSELMTTAAVPGFRAGRAPRKLVESRFRKEVTEQIKGSLLMDSLGQLADEGRFTAISEPEFDLEAVEVPDEGPMTFEFDIEVRPEFDLPDWKGLEIRRPVRELTEEDVDLQLEQMLGRYGRLVPYEGAARPGDYLSVNIRTTYEGKEVAAELEEVVRIRPVLSFTDGKLEGFDELMKDAKPGQRRKGTLTLTQDAPNPELRGKEVTVELEVLEVKELKLPELTEQFLEEMGDFESDEQLRKAVREDLQRQLEYEQQRHTRRQITTQLTESANWELPPAMLRRQSARELERAVMELRRAGFSEEDIRARENELRQNSAASTATALKEHFILERIAEEEELDVEEGDFDREITLIAIQSGEPPRRVRAQLEKRGLMDVLRNQIIERKVLQLMEEAATFVDEPLPEKRPRVEAIDVAAGGGHASTIPDVTEKEKGKESSGAADDDAETESQ